MHPRSAPPGIARQATFQVGTDVGMLMLFHPDALAAFEDWPIGWYDDAFVHEGVAREGRLIAWGTGEDGRFGVRLALTPGGADPLGAAERDRLAHVQDARCTVEHGALYLDGGDGLPHEEKRDDLVTDRPERRFALENGRYRARLHTLETVRGEDLHYVVSFIPVPDKGSWAAIPVAVKPPEFVPRHVETRWTYLLSGEALVRERQKHAHFWRLPRLPRRAPDAAEMRSILAGGIATRGRLALVPAPGLAVLPDEDRAIPVTNEWLGWVWGGGLGGRPPRLVHTHAIAAPRLADGAPAVLCRITGASRFAGRDGPAPVREPQLRLAGLAPVRLHYPERYAAAIAGQLEGLIGRPPEDADLWGRDRLMLVAATALAPRALPEEVPLPPETAERLRADIDTILAVDAQTPVLAARPSHHAHERAAVAAVTEPEALVDWLLHRLDLPGETRLGLWDAPHAERLAGMEKAIARAKRGKEGA